MAHFVELDDDNKVIRGIVVNNADTADADGVEDESIGIAFCRKLLGGAWKRTSYNTRGGEHSVGGTPFRKNYAGKGYTYDEDRDAFIPPKPFDSWVLDEDTCQWGAPVPLPDDAGPDKRYRWNEDEGSWEVVE
tara:strand:+ start:74 stop:472 length:399 start_codon:yes stop_codon:yes gene_type:complete